MTAQTIPGQWRRHERDAARRLAERHGADSITELLQRYLRRRGLYRLDAELAREALLELTGSRGPEPMGLRTWTPGEDDILAGGRLPVVVQVCIPFLAEQLEHADLEAAA